MAVRIVLNEFFVGLRLKRKIAWIQHNYPNEFYVKAEYISVSTKAKFSQNYRNIARVYSKYYHKERDFYLVVMEYWVRMVEILYVWFCFGIVID